MNCSRSTSTSSPGRKSLPGEVSRHQDAQCDYHRAHNSRDMEKTTIAGREVPIKQGPKIVVSFSGGKVGAEEAGPWEFWVLVGKDGRGTIGRCHPGSDPGERWRRMESARGYERHWEKAQSAEYLRPASVADVEVWLNEPSHQRDARFAESVEIDGKAMTIVRSYRLESAK
jgi:hypothetical protein